MAHFLMVEGWVSETGNLIIPLLKTLGHTYTFVTRNPDHYKIEGQSGLHPLFENAVDVIETDTNNIPALIERVRALKFEGVISVCDYYFEAVRAIADAFDLPCPLPRNLPTIRQKHLMRQALDQAGLPNANYRLAYTWEEVKRGALELGYPLVMKPVDLGSSAFVRLIRNEEELRAAFEALKAFPCNFRQQQRNHVILLEELLQGEEISVECVVFQGNITVIGPTDKSMVGETYFIESGHMFPAKVENTLLAETVEYVKQVLAAVGFDNGVAHTEVKLTANGPRIVEINPRTPGGLITELIERVTGISLLKVFVELALGKTPDLQRSDTGIQSAAIAFLIPPHEGKLAEIRGMETLLEDRHLVRYRIPNAAGRYVESPVDNACYLGHIIAVDAEDQKAGQYAREAIKRLTLIFED